MLLAASATALTVAVVRASSTRRVRSVAVMPSAPVPHTGEVNVRQRQSHFLAPYAGEADVNLRAGNQKIVHLEFLAGFAGGLAVGFVAGGWLDAVAAFTLSRILVRLFPLKGFP